MKNSIFIFLTSLILFACNNEKPTSQDDLFGEEVAKEKGTVFENSRVKDYNQSSIHFNKAITAFENGKMDEVVRQLNDGTNALVTEGQFLKGEPRIRLVNAVENLETIAALIKRGELKDISEVQRVIGAAQLTVAQEYVVDLNDYPVNVPLPDSYYPHFKAALKAVQSAEPHLKGEAKEAAKKLVKESESLFEKMDAGEKINEEVIKSQREKLNAFLKIHLTKQ